MSEAASRRRAFRYGLSGESVAAWFLRLQGYRILARRYRTPAGEVDIVARRGTCLVFVEVKARAAVSTALEAITPRQQRRVAAAARSWVARHPGDAALTLRFDAIFVAPSRWPLHIANAFEIDIG
jgi:putative endonuclease